jgi:hypothetical protein
MPPPERLELLTLLEEHERQQAEAPHDDRAPIKELFGKLRDEYAARSADPDAFKSAWDRHEAAAAAHFKRLEVEHPPSGDWSGLDTILAARYTNKRRRWPRPTAILMPAMRYGLSPVALF